MQRLGAKPKTYSPLACEPLLQPSPATGLWGCLEEGVLFLRFHLQRGKSPQARALSGGLTASSELLKTLECTPGCLPPRPGTSQCGKPAGRSLNIIWAAGPFLGLGAQARASVLCVCPYCPRPSLKPHLYGEHISSQKSKPQAAELENEDRRAYTEPGYFYAKSEEGDLQTIICFSPFARN